MDGLFRTSLFGGFNKSEVETYVKTVEEELERLRKNQTGDGQETENLREEVQKLTKALEEAQAQIAELNKGSEQKESTDGCESSEAETVTGIVEEEPASEKNLIMRVLKDAKFSAECIQNEANQKADSIINEAKQKAEAIVAQAEKDMEKRRAEGLSRLQKELEEKIIDFVTVRYRIFDYMKQIEAMQGSLTDVLAEFSQISKGMPASVQDLIEELKQDEIQQDEIQQDEIQKDEIRNEELQNDRLQKDK